jgi:hypothetical protein
MVSFYDPHDSSEQKHIEQLLRHGGIEYFLRETPEAELGTRQILVAEEDLPAAERVLTGLPH